MARLNTNYLILVVALLICVILSRKLQLALNQRRFAKSHGCKPVKKFPQRDPILGLDWFRAQLDAYKSHKFLEKATQRYEQQGATFSGTTMGRVFLLTIDLENIKTLLASNFQDFGLGPRVAAMGPFLGSGIFTTDGKAWEHSRALVRPNFNKTQINDLGQLETHVQNLIDRIPRDGSTVDLQELFFGLTIDSATEFLFGESCNFLATRGHGPEHDFVKAYEFCQSAVLMRPSNRVLGALWYEPKFKKACKVVHDFVDRYVKIVLQSRFNCQANFVDEKQKRYVFLEELAKETSDPKRLRDEVLNILLAGRDTTASLLSNTFHVFARRPDIWNALRDEVDKLGGETPTYEKLRDMRYLRYLLKESLRLYPVVPINTRYANKDTTLPHGGGPDGLSPIFVPKGTAITWHVYSMHRSREIYGPDALHFRPERWEENLRPGWGYLPFNGGPRICVGQQFALTEASYAIVRLVQHFSALESRDPEPWTELFGMTTASLRGTKVAMVPR